MSQDKALVVDQKNTHGSAQQLLQQAVAAGASIETLERLMALRKDMLAEEAKIAFNNAMAAFQEECPIIQKKTNVDRKYNYAKIESIIAQVKTVIKKNGFRYATTMEMTDIGVNVSVRVVHSMGHEEISVMQVPFGSGTSLMSKPQVVAAATTFAKRYAFLNAFGIMTGDEDIDGATNNLDESQASQLPSKLRKSQGGSHIPKKDFPATKAQKNCITRHWGELTNAEQESMKAWMVEKGIQSNGITKRQASNVIDQMQYTKKNRQAGKEPITPQSQSPVADPTLSGEQIDLWAQEMREQPDVYHLNQVWFRIKDIPMQAHQRKFLEDVRKNFIQSFSQQSS